MLAAVLKDFDRLLLEKVPIPEPSAGEVVVRIKSCGFCATDYKAIKGIRRNVSFPFIPGHEAAGVVFSVGPGVAYFKEGDEVAYSLPGIAGFAPSVGREIRTTVNTLLWRGAMVPTRYGPALSPSI